MANISEWKWFGCAGHLIVSQWCRFHLCTQVGAFLVSTVGEYWPERAVREIHAHVHDPKWLAENRHLKGDYFDAAYMKRFGFEAIGAGDDRYETMVFRLGGSPRVCDRPDCGCGLPEPISWSEIDGSRYMTAGKATKGHMEFCALFAERDANWKTEWEMEQEQEATDATD